MTVRPPTGHRKASRPPIGQRKASRPVAGQTLVFVGPTLGADEVRELLPGAVVRPPAAVGDILRAAREPGVRRIAIIDGYFERMAAVWHKEILIALERGIEVWGAASMGALRAAELEAFGMRGVGEIFKLYKRGALSTNAAVASGAARAAVTGAVTADDEVAVAHLPAEYGFRAVSDALVNIRYTLTVAVEEGHIDAWRADELLAQAKATFYRERVWKKLAPGLPLLDRKAEDARLLLKTLHRGRVGKQARRKISVPRTWALRQLERLML